MNNKIAYVAIPYSHNNPKVRELRFKIANNVAANLMNQGEVVYSAISHCHSIAVQDDLPTDWKYWEKNDRSFLECCYKLYVIKIKGWEDSKGVQAEIKIAKELDLEIEWVEYWGQFRQEYDALIDKEC